MKLYSFSHFGSLADRNIQRFILVRVIHVSTSGLTSMQRVRACFLCLYNRRQKYDRTHPTIFPVIHIHSHNHKWTFKRTYTQHESSVQ